MSEDSDNVIKFPPRPTPEGKYFDQIVHALQELPPATRIDAIAASCDLVDLQKLAELAERLAEPEPAA